MKALPPDDQSREKNNQKHRKRIKVMLTFFVLVLLGSLACALASLPRREAPTPSARRIPARYTQPEILVPEDRELLSDVRTSFIPTGAIALPPKDDLQEIVDRRSEGLQAGGDEIKKTMRFTRTQDKNEIFTNTRLRTILEDEISQFRDAVTNGDDIKYVNKRNDKESRIQNDDIRGIRRHESFVNLGDDEKGLRNRRETPINLTASSLVWQISPKSVNFTLDSEPLTWQEKNGKGPIDDVVDTFKSRSEQEDTITAAEINDESQSFIGAQSFWTSRGDQDSIRKTQADLMMQHMDQTADPCVDFYQYACGNWATLNPIPADKAGFDTFEMLRENLDVVLKDLLSTKHDCEEKKVNNMPNQNLDNENNVLRNLQQDNSKTYTNCKEHLKKNTFESFVAADNGNSHVNKITEDEMIPDYSKKRIKRHEKRIIEMSLKTKEKFQDNGNKEKKSSAKKSTKIKVKRQAIDGVNTINNGNDNNLKEGATLKARYLYESCMNYEILEKRGHKPLLELLDSLGGWPLLQQDWNETNFDWLELMARLRLYNNDILLSEWVGPDIKNSDEFVIQFDQTSLGLPTRDYFLQPVNDVYLEAYKNYLIKISTLLGSTYENAVKNADDLIGFESRLAKITSGPEERRNVSELYQRLTIDELKHMVPKIDWQRYLSIVLNRNAKLNETVVIFALKYVQDLVILLEQTEAKTISNYLLWRFVRHRVNNLDDRFQEAKQRFYFILFGREQAPPRWKNCVTQVNSNMGMALGSMFVRRYFDENSKNDTLIMTREIQESFRELLNLTAWIDDDTKILAGEKVDAMMLRIGYPDFILNEDELNERYREVSIHPDTYFENTLNILKHLTKIEQARLGQPVNKTVWNTAPAVVNAYYSRNKNQIMFPAGILQPPFYHRYFPKSLNYGGIGVVIGHEITHGFDDKGRLFDKYGNLHRWWHDMAIEMFHNRAQCLIDQYGHYTVSEVSMAIDGLNTQGENIADNGGIKQAFRAYQRWLQYNDDKDELLPGLNATNTQLFFLNFAQVWCGAMRPEAMKNKLKTAVHSPGKFRVIGTLSNSEDFSKEYKCPSGSPMNPVKKCNVW